MSRFKSKVGGDFSEANLVFVKASDLARAEFTGVVAEGQFIESLPNKFDEEKNDFKIIADTELKFEGIDKDGKPYKKLVNPGDTLVVNGAGNLNFLMSKVSVGDICQISYYGKREISKGKRKGTLAHTFEVAFGEE